MLPKISTQKERNVLWLITGLIAALLVVATLYQFYYILLLPVAIGLLLLAFFYTERALLFFGSLAPLSINFDDVGGGLGLALPTEPLFILMFLFISFRWLIKPNFKLEMLSHPISIAILAYLLWMWIATIFSTMPMVSVKFVLARTWYIVLFYFTCLSIFSQFKNIHWFFKAFTITTLGLVIFTLSKHAADGFIRSSSYGISWPFFPDHGMYAAAIAFAVFVLFIYAFAGRHFGISLPLAPFLVFLLAILLFGIVVSYTRATWLSLVAAIGVYAVLKMRIKFSWILLVLFGAFIYGIVSIGNISCVFLPTLRYQVAMVLVSPPDARGRYGLCMAGDYTPTAVARARVVIAELDSEVIRMSREHLHRVHRGALDDSRVAIRIGDVDRAAVNTVVQILKKFHAGGFQTRGQRIDTAHAKRHVIDLRRAAARRTQHACRTPASRLALRPGEDFRRAGPLDQLRHGLAPMRRFGRIIHPVQQLDGLLQHHLLLVSHSQ